MKKMLALFLALLLMLSLCSCGKSETRKETPAEDFTCKLDSDGNVIITGYTGSEQEIYIPSQINGHPVTIIGQAAFKGSNLLSVDIPEGVTSIWNDAFKNCEWLEEIHFPDSLIFIETDAFANCISLQKIKLPKNLEEIDERAFASCSNLTSVTLPKSLKYLRAYSFAYCTKLKELKIPDNFTGFYISTTTIYDTTIIHGSPVGDGSHTVMVVSKGSAAHSSIMSFASLPTVRNIFVVK